MVWFSRLAVLTTLLGLFALTFSLTKKTVPFELASVLDETHPVRKSYDGFSQLFENTHEIKLLITQDTPFEDSEIIAASRRLRKELITLKGVVSINAIDRAEYLDFDGEFLQFRSFTEGNSISRRGNEALQVPFWKDAFLTNEKDAFIVSIATSSSLGPAEEKSLLRKIFATTKTALKELPRATHHLIGHSVAKHHFLNEMIRNQSMVTPLLMIVLLSAMFFLFRSIQVLLAYLFVLTITYLSTISMILGLEGGFSPFNVFALFFVLVVTTSDFIHLAAAFRQTSGENFKDRLEKARNKVLIPCLLTTITTCVGFLSLVLNEMKPIQLFGVYAAFGSALCFVVTFYVLPFALLQVKQDWHLPPSKISFASIRHLVAVTMERRLATILAFALFFLLTSFGALGIKIDDNFYDKFPANHMLSQSVKAFNSSVGYVGSIDLIYSPVNGKLTDYEFEKELLDFERRIESLNGVTGVKSFASTLNYVRSVVTKETLEESETSVLTQPNLRASINFLKSYDVLQSVADFETNKARAIVNTDSLSTEKTKFLIESIHKLADNYKTQFDVSVSGFAALRTYIYDGVIRNLLLSFLICIGLIFLVFLAYLRSLPLALISMLPNLIPLGFCAGLFGYLSIPVEANLVLMLCVTIGIAVDDTIHFLYAIKNSGGDILKAFDQTSHALLGTTIVLAVSFPTLMLGELRIFDQIGVFVLASLLIALIADYLLLPAILSSVKPPWTKETPSASHNA